LSQLIDIPAISQNRPEITGVFFNFKKDKLRIASTDGFRLSHKKINLDLAKKVQDLELEKPLLVPARVFREIISLKDEEGEAEVYVSKKSNQILFEEDDIYIRIDMNSGRCCATAWTCDFSKEYVEINSEYST